MNVPATMQAIVATAPGGPAVLQPQQLPVPEPGPQELLIRVAFAGVNRPDALQRAGLYDPPADASPLLGLECAGTVVATGPGTTRWRAGDRVCALLPGGGYAEYACCPAAHALPVPEPLTLREAACLPETAFTVWSNVVMRAGLRPGERFLVHGGTSGIGTTAIQIAAALGATVFATAGSDAKCRICTELGASRAINYRDEDFTIPLREAGGADVILDMVGGSYLPRNIRALADDGRLAQIAVLGGARAEINLAVLMTRRLTLAGSTLRPQTREAKAAIAREVETHVWPMVARGALRPVIDSEFPLAAAADAHRRIEAPEHVGKIVLRVAG